MNNIAAKVNGEFLKRFTSTPNLYYSPGRINLIGEHVDYNDGFVMPAAIDKGVWYAISSNSTNQLNFHSIDFNESLSIGIDEVRKMDGWKNYVLSVVNEFLIRKYDIHGFDCVFGGNIANGAGLSSSAAVEGGLAFGLNEIFGCNITKPALATLCQQAEHNYPAVNCGIMDQFANMMGQKDRVILLDCKTLQYDYFPLKFDHIEIVLINTKVHHSLAASEYNKRREECVEGLKILSSDSKIRSFRDVANPVNLLPYKDRMGEKIYSRCLFVVEEIARTQKAAKLLQEDNPVGFGQLMFEAHEGLSKLYEVSCKELDFLVEQAHLDERVLGSRMMGGGFGGCTINLVRKEGVDHFLSTATSSYQQAFQIDPEIFRVNLEDGTHKL